MKKKGFSPFEPIRGTRAHEAVLAQIQKKILEGELSPNDRLPSERELMATFGVSRPTIREALRVAESLGLISVRHGDPAGPLVLGKPSVGLVRILDSLLSAERTSVAELLEVRIVLEGTIARLAASRLDRSSEGIEQAYAQMTAATDFSDFIEADALFHERVAEQSGNRLLLVILTALRDPILKLIEMGRGTDSEPRFRRQIIETHKRILEAIQTHNGPLADQISRRHIFDLYAKLVSPPERSRLEKLLT